MFIEILFKIVLFKGGVLIYTEHCIYIYIYIYINLCNKHNCACAVLNIYIYIYIYINTILQNVQNVKQNKRDHENCMLFLI